MTVVKTQQTARNVYWKSLWITYPGSMIYYWKDIKVVLGQVFNNKLDPFAS